LDRNILRRDFGQPIESDLKVWMLKFAVVSETEPGIDIPRTEKTMPGMRLEPYRVSWDANEDSFERVRRI
jgi:hypothetical protein